jgi:hypothetical protein
MAAVGLFFRSVRVAHGGNSFSLIIPG